MRKRQAPRSRSQVADTPGADGFCTGAHTKHRLRYHLVWVPKYRRRVLEGPVAVRLLALLRQACEVRRWGLHEINVQPDHVHLLLQASPAECVSDVVGSLKGGTSRILRSEFPDLEEYLSFVPWGATASGPTATSPKALVRKALVRKALVRLGRPCCAPTSRTRVCPSDRPEQSGCGPQDGEKQDGEKTGTFRI